MTSESNSQPAKPNMKFVISTIGPLAIAIFAGCGSSQLHIAQNIRLGGQHQIASMVVDSGVVVQVHTDLQITATDDIVIHGNLIATASSRASIKLTSIQGAIEIHGNIEAGDGETKNPVVDPVRAIGQDGGLGGDITLRSENSDVLIFGRLEAGDGGRGGDATAMGPGPSVYAKAGKGGLGGNIDIIAAGSIDLKASATVEAGGGGDGGEARAQLQIPDQPEIDDDELDEDGDHDPIPKPPTGSVARALSQAGGTGGNVTFELLPPGREVTVQANVSAGKGGDTSIADTEGAITGEATAEKAGHGGDVKFSVAHLTQVLDLTTPIPGDGGDCGVVRAPHQAFADAHRVANAFVGGGGDPGVVSGSSLPVEGEGGDRGAAIASLLGLNIDRKPGAQHVGSTPAPPVHASR